MYFIKKCSTTFLAVRAMESSESQAMDHISLLSIYKLSDNWVTI
jgi:hypothetical protein